jgi:hypothetical protein
MGTVVRRHIFGAGAAAIAGCAVAGLALGAVDAPQGVVYAVAIAIVSGAVVFVMSRVSRRVRGSLVPQSPADVESPHGEPGELRRAAMESSRRLAALAAALPAPAGEEEAGIRVGAAPVWRTVVVPPGDVVKPRVYVEHERSAEQPSEQEAPSTEGRPEESRG